MTIPYENHLAGDAMVSLLQTEGLINETHASAIIGDTFLSESKLPPSSANLRGREITWEDFERVYTDYDTYPTPIQVLHALGIPDGEFDPNEPNMDSIQRQTVKERAMRDAISKVARQFNRSGFPDKEGFEFVVPKKRASAYSKVARNRDDLNTPMGGYKATGSVRDQPSIDDIDIGNRRRASGRTARTFNRINNEDLLAGDLYNDRTRIPKTRWTSWLKFWDRSTSSVPNDSRGLREWKKIFIMGYQIESRLLYEIWFNTLDSTFSVHDIRGSEMTTRTSTLNEALKKTFNIVKQSSQSDREFFNTGNHEIAKSLGRSLSQDVESDPEIARMLKKERRHVHATERKKRMDADAKVRERNKRNAEVKKRVKSEIQARAKEYGGRVADAANNIGGAVADDLKTSARDDLGNLRDFIKGADIPNDEDFYRAASGSASPNTSNNNDKSKNTGSTPAPLTADEADIEIDKQAKRQQTRKEELKAHAKKLRDEADELEQKRTRDLAALDENLQVLQNEPRRDNDMVADDIENALGDKTGGSSYKNELKNIRSHAERQTMSAQRINDMVNDEQVTVYQKTRAPQDGVKLFDTINQRVSLNLPTDKPSLISRAKNAILGARYQADFVIGFSIADRVNFEVWYVTEPNPDYKWFLSDEANVNRGESKMISTFYVYDIQSQRIVRKFIPYYRQALQAIMAKIGAF